MPRSIQENLLYEIACHIQLVIMVIHLRSLVNTQRGQYLCMFLAFKKISLNWKDHIPTYLRSTEELVDKGTPGLVAFSTAGCHGLHRNLRRDGSPWHRAGVSLGEIVEHAACHDDVAASAWLHAQLGVQAVEPALQLAYCPACIIWTEWVLFI